MKKLLGDQIALTTFCLILLTWCFSACSAVTGIWFTRRSGLHHLSPAEIKDAWHLPLLVTLLWAPIILWRAWTIFREPAASPSSGVAAGHDATRTKDQEPAASTGVYVTASLLLFFGIALACNFAGDPQRWRVGVAILAVCALPFGVIFFRRIRLRRALGHAELHLDSRIQPGFGGVARYVRPLRAAVMKNVDVRLSCEELDTKKFGRIWVRLNRVLYEETLKPQVTPSADRIEIRIPLHIPPTGRRSISTGGTTVTWWLRLRLQMSGCPNTTSVFAIEVV